MYFLGPEIATLWFKEIATIFIETEIMKAMNYSLVSAKGACKHCGGIIRYYRGSDSCLLCGRSANHECPKCQEAESAFKKTA